MERIRMKDLPSVDRPYEKCLCFGPGVLSDAELLAVIIRTGSRDHSSLDLAGKLLALGSPGDGLLGLLHHSLNDFMKIKGVGKVKGIQLLCIGELSRRIWKKQTGINRISFEHPSQISDYYMEDMRHLEQEEIRVMFLNTKQGLIKDLLISRGTVNASVMTPRDTDRSPKVLRRIHGAGAQPSQRGPQPQPCRPYAHGTCKRSRRAYRHHPH